MGHPRQRPNVSHAVLNMSAEDFVEDWRARLEQLGGLFYSRSRPALACLTATGDDEYPASEETVARRHLVVGWRNWFGPVYVQAFGRDRLLGL